MFEDAAIIQIFTAYDQQALLVYLSDDRVCTVYNIAWAYDQGDEQAHITTNVSPAVKNADTDFFYTGQIRKIEACTHGTLLFKR